MRKIKLYRKQKYTLIIGGIIFIFLFFLNIDSPQTLRTEHIILLSSVIILFLIESRLREDYKKGVEFTDKTIRLISQNICPICEINKTGKKRIKVGYTIDKSYAAYKIWKLLNNHNRDEISGSVPICDNCEKEFLAFRLSDPSKMLLEGKSGFHRGLFYPYLKENIFTEE